MLDRYFWGDVDRISPEAPVVIINVTERQERPGGTGSEAVNLAAQMVGWRGWVNARLEMTLSGTDAPVTVTMGYTKIPNGEDFANWDAKR